MNEEIIKSNGKIICEKIMLCEDCRDKAPEGSDTYDFDWECGCCGKKMKVLEEDFYWVDKKEANKLNKKEANKLNKKE